MKISEVAAVGRQYPGAWEAAQARRAELEREHGFALRIVFASTIAIDGKLILRALALEDRKLQLVFARLRIALETEAEAVEVSPAETPLAFTIDIPTDLTLN